MGYRVRFLVKNRYTHRDYPNVVKVDVKQNHLYLYNNLDDIIAIYQSGWWMTVTKLEENQNG